MHSPPSSSKRTKLGVFRKHGSNIEAYTTGRMIAAPREPTSAKKPQLATLKPYTSKSVLKGAPLATLKGTALNLKP